MFISHSSLDREMVEREIIAPLRQYGVEAWYSKDSIETASQWERRIRQGLNSCDWFLIVLSPRSVASDWVKSEVDWALAERRDHVIPVMLETCDPSDLHLRLRLIQHIDYRQGAEKSLDRLLAVWGLDKASQVKARHQAAREALAKEEWAAAIEHLEAVLRLDPTHAGAHSELEEARRRHALAGQYAAGLAHLRAGRWQEALDALQQVRREDGGYKEVSDLIAEAGRGLNREEAERLYLKALDAASREDWPAAAEQLRAVLRLDAAHAEARAALGRAQHQVTLAQLYGAGLADLEARRWHEALKSLRRVRALDRNYKGVADLIAEADAGLAEEENEQAGLEEGERAKEESGTLPPPRPDFYREALDALSREEWGAAREKLRAAQELNPDDGAIADKLDEVDRRQRAAEDFKTGLGHFEAGRWAEASEAFRRVQSAAGDYKDVSRFIARAEAELKRVQEQEEQKERDKRARLEREEQERKRRAEDEERRRREAEAAEAEVVDGGRPKISPKAVAGAAAGLGVILLAVIVYAMWPDGGDVNRDATQTASAVAPSATPLVEPTSADAPDVNPQNTPTTPSAGPTPKPTRQDNTSRVGAGATGGAGTQQSPDEAAAAPPSKAVERPARPPVSEVVADEEPPPAPKPKPKTVVSNGVLNGRAISLPKPAYPPIARSARASGTVTVQIVVDESGRVISANAVSGHPLLQQAAVSAAWQARFSPTLLSGQAVRVSGVVTYNFVYQ